MSFFLLFFLSTFFVLVSLTLSLLLLLSHTLTAPLSFFPSFFLPFFSSLHALLTRAAFSREMSNTLTHSVQKNDCAQTWREEGLKSANAFSLSLKFPFTWCTFKKLMCTYTDASIIAQHTALLQTLYSFFFTHYSCCCCCCLAFSFSFTDAVTLTFEFTCPVNH